MNTDDHGDSAASAVVGGLIFRDVGDLTISRMAFGPHGRAVALAGTIVISACAPRVAPEPEWPDSGPSEAQLVVSLQTSGFRPLPSSCASIQVPITTVEQAACVAVDRLGADIDRSAYRFMYKGQQIGSGWELSILPVALVLGGGGNVAILAESGAIAEVQGQR